MVGGKIIFTELLLHQGIGGEVRPKTGHTLTLEINYKLLC